MTEALRCIEFCAQAYEYAYKMPEPPAAEPQRSRLHRLRIHGACGGVPRACRTTSHCVSTQHHQVPSIQESAASPNPGIHCSAALPSEEAEPPSARLAPRAQGAHRRRPTRPCTSRRAAPRPAPALPNCTHELREDRVRMAMTMPLRPPTMTHKQCHG